MSGPPHHRLGILMLKPVTPPGWTLLSRRPRGAEAIGRIRTSPDL